MSRPPYPDEPDSRVALAAIALASIALLFLVWYTHG